jgi:urease accessory protein UreH
MTGRDARGSAHVGRVARIDLEFHESSGATVLGHAYAEPPFRVPAKRPGSAPFEAVLQMASPGIFGGDCLAQRISITSGAAVDLTSQSALQAHPGPTPSAARLTSRYRLAGDASLACHWDPVIPFSEARLEQKIEICLASTSTLYWSDAFMAGRNARGEQWRFCSLAHELRVTRSENLVYLERFQLGPDHGPRDEWSLVEGCYFGTVLAAGVLAQPEVATALHRSLARINRVRAATDIVDDCLLIVRLVSSDGPAFHRARALAKMALSVFAVP